MENSKRIPKSIYLDWNVIQDMIHNRRSNRLGENLIAAQARGFAIPFSYGHISDLARSKDGEYLQKDLKYVETLTHSLYLNMSQDCAEVRLERVPPQTVLDHVRMVNGSVPPVPLMPHTIPSYQVAIEQLAETNLLIPYLSKFDGYMCQGLIDNLMKDLHEKGLADHTLQRNLRKSFSEVVKLGNPAFPELSKTPIYKYMFASKEEIEEHFQEILDFLLKLSSKSIDSIGEAEKFTSSYLWLDFFWEFKEKIHKRNNMNNMITDAIHAHMASKCSTFVCGDDGLIEKARFLYRFFNVPTKIYHVDTFIDRVSY